MSSSTHFHSPGRLTSAESCWFFCAEPIPGSTGQSASSKDDISKNDNEEGTTVALIKGVLAGCRNRGFSIGGFNAYITSDVLGGSGLSSSAAFETVIGNIISNLYNDGKIDAVTIAKIGQYAENHYFGKPCGLMDMGLSNYFLNIIWHHHNNQQREQKVQTWLKYQD